MPGGRRLEFACPCRRGRLPSAFRRVKKHPQRRRLDCRKGTHGNQLRPHSATARRPRRAVRPSPRIPAGPRQGPDVCRHVHAVAGGGEADPRAARGQTLHPRDGALLRLHRRADDPRQRPAASPAPGGSPSASTWPTTSTRTSWPTPPTASPSTPARSSWSSSAPPPPSGRASRRRSAPSSPPTPMRSGSSKRPSRSRPASRGRRSSPSHPSGSPTPTARAATGGSASGRTRGRSTFPPTQAAAKSDELPLRRDRPKTGQGAGPARRLRAAGGGRRRRDRRQHAPGRTTARRCGSARSA